MFCRWRKPQISSGKIALREGPVPLPHCSELSWLESPTSTENPWPREGDPAAHLQLPPVTPSTRLDTNEPSLSIPGQALPEAVLHRGAHTEHREHEGERESPSPPWGCKEAQRPPPLNAWGAPQRCPAPPGLQQPRCLPSLPPVPRGAPAVPSASRRACGAASPGSAEGGEPCPPPLRGCSFSCPQPDRASRWLPPIGPGDADWDGCPVLRSRGWAPGRRPHGAGPVRPHAPGVGRRRGAGSAGCPGEPRRAAFPPGPSGTGGFFHTVRNKCLAEPKQRGWLSLRWPRSHPGHQGGL